MKKIFTLLAVAALVASCFGNGKKADATEETTEAATEVVATEGETTEAACTCPEGTACANCGEEGCTCPKEAPAAEAATVPVQ